MALFGISKKGLKIFLERSLSKREQQLLLDSYRLQGFTFSSAVAKLSKKYPESTAKLVLKRLENFGLVKLGNVKEKGKPLTFTSFGETVCEILRGSKMGD